VEAGMRIELEAVEEPAGWGALRRQNTTLLASKLLASAEVEQADLQQAARRGAPEAAPQQRWQQAAHALALPAAAHTPSFLPSPS
jgi:hypothetical protein